MHSFRCYTHLPRPGDITLKTRHAIASGLCITGIALRKLSSV